MPLLRPVVRRALGAGVVVAGLALSYAAGVATGTGRPAAQASGVLDDAAAQIQAAALRPVDRQTLDAAALHGMLGAAGDPWGSWAGGPSEAALPGSAPVRTISSAGVARVVVPAFGPGVGRQVQAAVASLAGRPGGLLLDLRGNPGGRLDEAVATASAFLDGGPVVAYTRRDAGPRRLVASGHGDTTTPLVVLVDGGTASAAEVVAAALQDRERAVLVGTRTFGKGSVQEPQTLPDGTALELTVARWTAPSGRSVDGSGLVPDVEVPAGAPASVAERRGAQVLEGLRAGAGGKG